MSAFDLSNLGRPRVDPNIDAQTLVKMISELAAVPGQASTSACLEGLMYVAGRMDTLLAGRLQQVELREQALEQAYAEHVARVEQWIAEHDGADE